MESPYLRILMEPKWLWRGLWSHKAEVPLAEVITDKGPALFRAGVIHWLKKPPYPKERTQARTWGAAVAGPSSASDVRSMPELNRSVERNPNTRVNGGPAGHAQLHKVPKSTQEGQCGQVSAVVPLPFPRMPPSS